MFQFARHLLVMRRTRCAAESAAAVKIAIDRFCFSKLLDEVDEANALLEDRVRAINAVTGGKAFDTQLVKTRAEHAAVAGAGAITGIARLAYEHGFPRLREHARRAQAAEAAANDKHVDLPWQFR